MEFGTTRFVSSPLHDYQLRYSLPFRVMTRAIRQAGLRSTSRSPKSDDLSAVSARCALLGFIRSFIGSTGNPALVRQFNNLI